MFWFWFWWTMLVLDGLWWLLVMRWTKRTLWRVLISVFISAQMAVLLSLISELLDSHVYPKAILVAVVLWHRIVLPLALGVLAVVAIVRFRARRKNLRADPAEVNSQTRREFIGACAAVVPSLFTIGVTGATLAQLRQVRVRRFILSMPTLPRALDGTTIAHVSDMHVGRWTCGPILREMINKTNALRPDLVLFTGDLIDYELADLGEAIATIKAMQGRYGQWMIEGNHDLLQDGAEFGRRVKAAGVPLLLDDSTVADVRGHPIQFFGLRWMGFGRGAEDDRHRDRLTAMQMRLMLKQRQPDAFPILLAHHPHALDVAAKADLPLILAGHTHGGQWMLNPRLGVGPLWFRYWSGLYSRGRSQMIVSNGVGNVFPLRVNAPAEIIHITLRRA
ncbi:MAG TPA: metallophosphoesterase [Verrucomicrobiae bacterium]|nr:metallophosphoesterase [Verrucomicrobiae bacterium]